MNNIDKQKLIDTIIASSGGKINRSDVNSAASGDLSAIMSALSDEDRRKLSAALSDEKAAKQMLSGASAQKILRMFLDGGNK